MSYFVAGLWHWAAAMVFAAAFGILGHDDILFWLRRWEFALPLLIASCALFFVPDSLSKKGLLKFLHYPLPDWDVLLLGPASHRHWLTHSPILPAILLFLAWRYPLLMEHALPFGTVAAGLSIGIGSHLFWDCVGSRTHKIIVVPYWFSFKSAFSRLWLLAGAAICFGAAASFGDVKLSFPFRLDAFEKVRPNSGYSDSNARPDDLETDAQ